jgi:nicotinate-nucleotide pyrophosphorylase
VRGVLFDSELESLLRDDLPHLDLTTVYMGVESERGVARLVSRSRGVLAGSEEAADVYEKAGAVVKHLMGSGSGVSIGTVVLEARAGYKRDGVEVGSLEGALEAVEAGADYVHFDRVDPATLRSWVSRLRSGSAECRSGSEAG